MNYLQRWEQYAPEAYANIRLFFMAFYILILKDKEDENGVTYSFGPNEDHLGALWLDKLSGEVKELQETPTQNPQAFFQGAAVKVRQYWKKGLFPEKTCWAS